MNILLALIKKDFICEVRSGRLLIALGTAIALTALTAIGAEQAQLSAELQAKSWPIIMAMVFLVIAEQLLHGSFTCENAHQGSDNLFALKLSTPLILGAKLILFSLLIFIITAVAQIVSTILLNLPIYFLTNFWALLPLSVVFTSLFIPISFYLALYYTGRSHGIILLLILPLFMPCASAYMTYISTGELTAATPIFISLVVIVPMAFAVCSKLRNHGDYNI